MIGTNIIEIQGISLGANQSTEVQSLNEEGSVDMNTALTYGGLRMPQVEDEITSMSYNDCQSTFHGFPIALKRKLWIEYVCFDIRGLNAFYFDEVTGSKPDEIGGIRGMIKAYKSMYFKIWSPEPESPTLPENPDEEQIRQYREALKEFNMRLKVYSNFSPIIPPYDDTAPEKSYYYLGAQPKLEINNDASSRIKGTIKMQFIQIQGIMLNSIIPTETQSAYNAIVSEES